MKDYLLATGSLHDDFRGSFHTVAQHYMRSKQPLKSCRASRKQKKTGYKRWKEEE